MPDMEAKDWKHYYEEMKRKAPLIIYYPLCGGGEECISVCPYADKVWTLVPMRVRLFGLGGYRVRLRPYMAHPEHCKRCYLCLAACPTGALMRADSPAKHPGLRFLATLAKLPFRKRYSIRFVFRREHIERFKRNNRPGGRG